MKHVILKTLCFGMVSLSIMESYAQTFPVNLKENQLKYSKYEKGNRE